jgi:hypothetical protein
LPWRPERQERVDEGQEAAVGGGAGAERRRAAEDLLLQVALLIVEQGLKERARSPKARRLRLSPGQASA